MANANEGIPSTHICIVPVNVDLEHRKRVISIAITEVVEILTHSLELNIMIQVRLNHSAAYNKSIFDTMCQRVFRHIGYTVIWCLILVLCDQHI